MKLLRLLVLFLGACLIGSAHGQANSSGAALPASSQTHPPEAPASERSFDSNGQNTQGGADTKSDTQSDEHHHRYHLRLGTISVGAGYSYFSGPFFYNPFLTYRFYPYSLGYSPFYAPGYYGGFSYGSDKGEVKLSGAPKRAEVYLDGAYAGTADKLRNMWLTPGAYDLSVSAPGTAAFHQRIYVLSGKSLKIAAKLSPQETKPKTTEEKQ
jgi:PEGA domain